MTVRKPVTALVVNYEVVSSLLKSLRENIFGDAGCDHAEVRRLVGRLTAEIEGPKAQRASSPPIARQPDPPVFESPIRTYRVRDLAQLLHLHCRTIQRMLREKQIVGKRVGRNWLVEESAIQRFLVE